MARNQAAVECAPGEWTQLTNADVTSITFQVMPGSGPVFIRYTTDTTTPTETHGATYFATKDTCEGELNASISTLVNLAGADRVWARPVSENKAARVYVDHA